jgi:transcriptional regulator with XRE-family HTH domain
MDNSTPNNISKLRSERRRRGWTRKYLAEQLGVSDYTIGQWERGKHMPYPVHIQKLCHLFDASPEMLGLIGDTGRSGLDEASLETKIDQNRAIRYPALEKRRYLLFSLVGAAIILTLAFGVMTFVIPAHIKPGGVWISPYAISSTVGDRVYLAVSAYPTNQGDPAIDHVNFTMYWPGVDPHVWKIVCVVRVPTGNNTYACNINLRSLGALPGSITVSFDVYDRQGHVSFAPNGKHHLIYVPS